MHIYLYMYANFEFQTGGMTGELAFALAGVSGSCAGTQAGVGPPECVGSSIAPTALMGNGWGRRGANDEQEFCFW